MTLLALAVEVALSLVVSDQNRNVRRVIGTCDWVVKTGFGAVIGLLVGKATR